MKRITISLPDPVHSVLCTFADAGGRSTSNYAAYLIEETLKKEPGYEEEIKKATPRKIDQIPAEERDKVFNCIEKYQVDQLRQLAKERDIKNCNKLDKAQLTFVLAPDVPEDLLMTKEEFLQNRWGGNKYFKLRQSVET